MALKEYQAKRQFDRTPEPSGRRRTTKASSKKAAKGRALRFVIQKHAASHLHYDFRLELDGVLKSWAVPKGPSLNPKDKRLAMQVEDHPLDYQSFEGMIPQGNYGAGAVIIWEQGEYFVKPEFSRTQNEKALKEGLEAGKLTFHLKGHKLRGEFSLIRIKSRDSKENTWLLIKADDEEARGENILAQDRSVMSGKTLDELAEQTTRPKKSHRPSIQLDPSLKDAMPHRVKPMLATLVDKPFDKNGWFFEVKWDGYRAIAEVENGHNKLYSRNLLSFEKKFPLVYEELNRLQSPCVLDGEIVALDDDGKPSFQRLQDYESNQERIVYYVFDLLYLDGYNLQNLPLKERKKILRNYLPNLPRIRYCEHVETRGVAFFEASVQQGLEGIIAKDSSSVYLAGKRSSAWLKIKTQKRQEAIICGFTAPRGGRKNIGALILGVYEGKTLKYIGHTGTGMDTKTLKQLHEQLPPLSVEKSPFEKTPKTNEKPTWVKPLLVCEVVFTEWTYDQHMRHPVYLGLRPDKAATDVTFEPQQAIEAVIGKSEPKAKKTDRQARFEKEPPQRKKQQAPPEPAPKFAKEAPDKKKMQLMVDGHRVTVSNPERLLWPKAGYRKKDMVAYYRSVAKMILPYLKDRPYVMHRFPKGIKGESFYQKDVNIKLPEWVETIEVYSESNEQDIRYVICQNEETLVWLANLGCIEMNPWNSRKQKLEYPDWMVLDLDPQGIGFEKVIETAQVAHQILDDWKIPNYCKTSGATGLHIYVPLGAKYHYDTARDFGNVIAMLVHRELPKTTSLERSPSKRTHQIYLDYLQNRYGQTLVAPYSLRPTPEATVSTPLLWEEVKKGLRPTQFTIQTLPKRLKETGDLWKPVLGPGINLKSVLRQMNINEEG